jgi:hypothetical protein
MQALGKMKNPLTGKIEKNLEQARQSIEIIEMLKAKTANNLSPESAKALDNFLAEIRLNYVDEMNKAK